VNIVSHNVESFSIEEARLLTTQMIKDNIHICILQGTRWKYTGRRYINGFEIHASGSNIEEGGYDGVAILLAPTLQNQQTTQHNKQPFYKPEQNHKPNKQQTLNIQQ
jgi:hypothetical protein